MDVSELSKYLKIKTKYKVFIEGLGWQEYKEDGKGAGTTWKSLRIEAIKIEIPFKPCKGEITYRVEIEDFGWSNWCKEGEIAGLEGKGKKLQHIEIKLKGGFGDLYDVHYRTHSFLVGWQKWVKNGETTGFSRIEMIQICISPKFQLPEP